MVAVELLIAGFGLMFGLGHRRCNIMGSFGASLQADKQGFTPRVLQVDANTSLARALRESTGGQRARGTCRQGHLVKP